MFGMTFQTVLLMLHCNCCGIAHDNQGDSLIDFASLHLGFSLILKGFNIGQEKSSQLMKTSGAFASIRIYIVRSNRNRKVQITLKQLLLEQNLFSLIFQHNHQIIGLKCPVEMSQSKLAPSCTLVTTCNDVDVIMPDCYPKPVNDCWWWTGPSNQPWGIS